MDLIYYLIIFIAVTLTVMPRVGLYPLLVLVGRNRVSFTIRQALSHKDYDIDHMAHRAFDDEMLAADRPTKGFQIHKRYCSVRHADDSRRRVIITIRSSTFCFGRYDIGYNWID